MPRPPHLIISRSAAKTRLLWYWPDVEKRRGRLVDLSYACRLSVRGYPGLTRWTTRLTSARRVTV
jgi:hypothetical protein